MKNARKNPTEREQKILDEISIVLLEEKHERKELQALLEEHHYLGGLQAAGEQLHYTIVDGKGEKLGGFIFSAATPRLKHRDNSIGWSKEQRRRRLGLVVNNSRFLLIPDKSVPNMGSKALKMVLQRLSADWQKKYAHPVILVETFVDPDHFNGACYDTNGWKNVGSTAGYGKASRTNRDFYEFHGRPKLLFIKELVKNARRSLQAEHLRKELLCVEAKVPPHPTLVSLEMRSLVEHFKAVPEYRGYVGIYPLFTLLSIIALAHLASAPRGGKDLAAFAKRLSTTQRQALGIRRQKDGTYPTPSQPTFCRLYQRINTLAVEQALINFQNQVRGKANVKDLVVIDGKKPRHGGGPVFLSAITAKSMHYLGGAMVSEKTNEVPVARDELFGRLDLDGRMVSLDAAHTCVETAQDLVLKHGANYLLTVKGNQPTVKKNIELSLDGDAVHKKKAPDPS